MTKVSTKLAGQSVPDKIAYHTVRTIVTVFCRVWCRMSIEGRDNIPTSGPFILAPTHRSIIDTPVASGVYRRRMRFMGADKWWSNKHFGNLLSALGGFPVSRGSADREALKRCIAVIEGGEPLVLFPEGERKSGPVVQPLGKALPALSPEDTWISVSTTRPHCASSAASMGALKVKYCTDVGFSP